MESGDRRELYSAGRPSRRCIHDRPALSARRAGQHADHGAGGARRGCRRSPRPGSSRPGGEPRRVQTLGDRRRLHERRLDHRHGGGREPALPPGGCGRLESRWVPRRRPRRPPDRRVGGAGFQGWHAGRDGGLRRARETLGPASPHGEARSEEAQGMGPFAGLLARRRETRDGRRGRSGRAVGRRHRPGGQGDHRPCRPGDRGGVLARWCDARDRRRGQARETLERGRRRGEGETRGPRRRPLGRRLLARRRAARDRRRRSHDQALDDGRLQGIRHAQGAPRLGDIGGFFRRRRAAGDRQSRRRREVLGCERQG